MATLHAKTKTPEFYLETQFEQIKAALPRHVDADRIRRICLTELRKNDKLREVANRNPLSFFGAVIQAAQLGLEPGQLGQCYFIPFGNEVAFVLGYQGMIELIMRSGKVTSLMTNVVCPGEYFEHAITGEGVVFRHVPDYEIEERTEENIALVYAIAKMKEGGSLIEVMSKTQINKNEQKNRKGQKRSGPWNDYWDQMARKTLVRRIYKYLPKSVELAEFLGDEDNDEIGGMSEIAKKAGLGKVIDVPSGAQSKTALGAKSLMDSIKNQENPEKEAEEEKE